MRHLATLVPKIVCIAILVGTLGRHAHAQSNRPTCGVDQPEVKSRKAERANQQAVWPVPFSYISRNIVIDGVYVGNSAGHYEYATFIIDSGQTRTMVAPRLVTSLGLPIVGGGNLISATGQIPVKYVQIGAVELGDRYYCKNIEAAVQDLTKFSGHLHDQVDGIIGMDFLKSFNLLIDIPRGRFGFVENAKLPNEFKEIGNAQLEYRNDLLMLKCNLPNGLESNLIVDTGNEYPEDILLYDDVLSKLELQSPLSCRPGGDLISSTAIRSGQIAWVDIGNLRLAPAKVGIQPLSQDNPYGTPIWPGLMGMGLFEKFAVEIDGPGLLLRFLEGPKILSRQRRSRTQVK
jgi:hypothetical protein